MPLTQEDIPRLIEGVVKSLAEIDSQREPTTSDRAPTSTSPTTTMTTHPTPSSDGATTPHPIYHCARVQRGYDTNY